MMTLLATRFRLTKTGVCLYVWTAGNGGNPSPYCADVDGCSEIGSSAWSGSDSFSVGGSSVDGGRGLFWRRSFSSAMDMPASLETV